MYSASAASATSASNTGGGRENCPVCSRSFPNVAAMISHCEVTHQQTQAPAPAQVPVVVGTPVPDTRHKAPGGYLVLVLLCSWSG